MRVDFEGGKQVEDMLRDLQRAGRKSVARRVLKRAGDLILAAVDVRRNRSGALAASFTVSTRLTRRNARDARRMGKSDVEVYVGSADPAATANEFGNSRIGHAIPTLRPAWAAKKQAAFDLIAKEMTIEVGKAVQRAKRRAATLARKMGV